MAKVIKIVTILDIRIFTKYEINNILIDALRHNPETNEAIFK